MTITNIQTITDQDTFGQWWEKTNDVIDSLARVATLGESEGNVGNLKIEGELSSTTKILTNVIEAYDSGTNLISLGSNLLASETIYLSDINTWVKNESNSIKIGQSGLELVFNLSTGVIGRSGNVTISDDLLPNSISGNIIGQVSDIGNHSTDALSEGSTNKYFSDVLARNAISVNGSSDLSYSTTTGVINLPRSLSGDYSISSGSLAISNANDGSTLLTLTDTSTAAYNKIMMRVDGSGDPLDLLNYNDTGDYEFRSGDTAIRLNDSTKGFQIFHRSATDSKYDEPFGSSHTDLAPFAVETVSGIVRTTVRTDLHVTQKINTADIEATGTAKFATLDMSDGNFVSPEGFGVIPSGGIIMWSGATVPEGWGICNGSQYTYEGKTTQTPNLADRFIVAAGQSYDIGATGGTNSVTLTVDQMPSHSHSHSLSTNSAGSHSHTHSLTTNSAGSHSHSFNLTTDTAGQHIHQIYANNRGNYGGQLDGLGAFRDDAETLLQDWQDTIRPAGAHTHNISGSINSGGSHKHTVTGTIASSGSHSHTITGSIGSTGGNQAHENRPPYYALAFIMKL